MQASTHLRASLLCLTGFLVMGLVLEAMLGLRAPGLVDDALRREFLRLGHAHGGLLALVNVGLGWALERLTTPSTWAPRIRLAAWSGSLLVGLGFAGGGLWHGATDPGPLVLLAPAGALMLVTSLLATALLRGTGPGDAGQTSNRPS